MQKGVPQIMDITSIRSVLYYLSKSILPSKFETAFQTLKIICFLVGVQALKLLHI